MAINGTTHRVLFKQSAFFMEAIVLNIDEETGDLSDLLGKALALCYLRRIGSIGHRIRLSRRWVTVLDSPHFARNKPSWKR